MIVLYPPKYPPYTARTPPTIYDYLRVGLLIMSYPFTAFVFSSKAGCMTRMAGSLRNTKPHAVGIDARVGARFKKAPQIWGYHIFLAFSTSENEHVLVFCVIFSPHKYEC